MADPRRTLILANGGSGGAIGERARWVALAAGGADVAYREGARLSAVRHFAREIRRVRPEVVYLVDCAVSTVVAGAIARAILGAHIVLDTGDAIGALAFSTGRGGRLGGLLASGIERLGYRIASTIVVRSDGLEEHVRALSGRTSVVIPDGFDPSIAGPRDGKQYRSSWKAGESVLVIGVVGSANWNARLEWCYGRDVIGLLAHTDRRDVTGVLLVRGNGVPHLENLAKRLGVSDRVAFATPEEGEAFWEQLGAIDIALSTQTNDAVGRARTTGKLVQYLAAGKFILASRVGTAAKVLPEEMLVDYHGAWDPGYFHRLGERVNSLGTRCEVRSRGSGMTEVADRFSYARLVERLRTEVFGAVA